MIAAIAVRGFFALLAALPFAPQLHTGDTVPAIPLTTEDGRPFSLDRLHGRAVVLSFVFSRCTASCALTAAKLARVARDADPQRLAVVALTVDPNYDRPAVLRRYRALFETPSRWTLATGEPSLVVLLERRLGVEPESGAQGRTDHADLVVVLDPAGRIARFVSGRDWTSAQMIALAGAVDGGKTDPGVAVAMFLTDALARCGRGLVSFGMGTLLAITVLLTLAIGMPFVRALRK